MEAIAGAPRSGGQMSRSELQQAVGARGWGPGRFRPALRTAVEEERARLVGRNTFASGEREPVGSGSRRA